MPQREGQFGLGFVHSGARAGLLSLAMCVVCAAGGPTEYEVKAAFLLNFTKFVEWPASSFENGDSPLSICILGSDPFGPGLDQIVEGETVDGRRVTVHRVRDEEVPKSCRVVFLSKSETDVRKVLARLDRGVLTVSDREDFLAEGGMIGFVLQDRRVRFDVNQRAAARAYVKISARLLRVARSVQK